MSAVASSIASGHDASRALLAVAEQSEAVSRAEAAAAAAAAVSHAVTMTAAALTATQTTEKPVQAARGASAKGSERAQMILGIMPVGDRRRHEISTGREVVSSCRAGYGVVEAVPIGVGRARIAQA
jgi:hypothetical protein